MKLIKTIAALGLMAMLAACSYRTVPAGNEGVKFNLYGSGKGVQAQQVGPGRYFLTWNEYLYEFPTFTQTYTWTQNPNESSNGDESITFQTVEGLSVNADVGITYHVEPDKVTLLFQKYRKGIDEITNTYLRNMVRDSLVKEASNQGIENVYGHGKAALIEAVQHDVAEQTAPIGIVIEKVYWIGDLRLPKNVVAAINAKIQATQMAEQRKNEVAQAQAEAQKEVAVAQGRAQANLELANAEAQSIKVRGEALRQNPDVIRLQAIQKWDGKMPVYSGSGATPFIEVGK